MRLTDRRCWLLVTASRACGYRAERALAQRPVQTHGISAFGARQHEHAICVCGSQKDVWANAYQELGAGGGLLPVGWERVLCPRRHYGKPLCLEQQRICDRTFG